MLTGHKAKRFVIEQRRQGADRRAATAAKCASPFDVLLCAVGRVAEHRRLRAGGARHRHHASSAPWRPTNICRPSIPTSTPAATWPARISSRTPPRTRPGTRAVNALFGALQEIPRRLLGDSVGTFTDPEVARVGLNETEAQGEGHRLRGHAYGIDDLDRAIADEEAHGMVKVLTVPGKDRILGATIVGEHAGDLIVEFITRDEARHRAEQDPRHHPHLSDAGRSQQVCRRRWKRAHAPQRLLRWVERYHAWSAGVNVRAEPSEASTLHRHPGAERSAAHRARAARAAAAARARPRGDRGRRRQRRWHARSWRRRWRDRVIGAQRGRAQPDERRRARRARRRAAVPACGHAAAGRCGRDLVLEALRASRTLLGPLRRAHRQRAHPLLRLVARDDEPALAR